MKNKEKNTDKETYALTLKGLLMTHVDETIAESILDNIELYCYRMGLRNDDTNTHAIVLDKGVWYFSSVETEPDKCCCTDKSNEGGLCVNPNCPN